MDKKGAELALNVLIIAIIGLLILVIVIAIATGKLGDFSQKSGDCAVQGGKCAVECGNSDFGTESYSTRNAAVSCEENAAGESQVCCLPITT